MNIIYLKLMFCNIRNVFTVTFKHFNAFFLNKNINKKTQHECLLVFWMLYFLRFLVRQIALYCKIAKMKPCTSRNIQQITAIYEVISGWITPVTFRPILQLNETLTDGGDQIQEALLGENRVLQPSEIQLENASRRVDVMIALIINQWVLTWNKWRKNCDYGRKMHSQTSNI